MDQNMSTSDAGSDSSADNDLSSDSSSDQGDTFADGGSVKCNVNRGVWMYRHPVQPDPLGTDVLIDDTVNDTTDELAVIANLNANSIFRVYGNYGKRPSTDAANIAAWNSLLDNAGIQSQVLIGDAKDIFPSAPDTAAVLCRNTLFEDIQARFIDFNNAHPLASEQFKGIHLDIEPQQYNTPSTSCGYKMMNYLPWSDLTPPQKTQRYMLLLQTLIDARHYLDTHGQGSAKIFIDLAPWVDSIPSMSFVWPATYQTLTATDGLDWLVQAAGIVDGITFMTYSRATAAQIHTSVTNEVSLATEVRVSVNAKERLPYASGTPLWMMDLTDMWSTVNDYEMTFCEGMDLFNYKYIEE